MSLHYISMYYIMNTCVIKIMIIDQLLCIYDDKGIQYMCYGDNLCTKHNHTCQPSFLMKIDIILELLHTPPQIFFICKVHLNKSELNMKLKSDIAIYVLYFFIKGRLESMYTVILFMYWYSRSQQINSIKHSETPITFK